MQRTTADPAVKCSLVRKDVRARPIVAGPTAPAGIFTALQPSPETLTVLKHKAHKGGPHVG
jgi:hypothetical protein